MIKFIKKMRWYVWLFLAWPVLNIIYFLQEKNYHAAFFAGAYCFMVFLFLHRMETIKETLQKENGSEFENAVAFEKLYKKHENLILENFERRSDLSKKKLEIEELEKDKKILI